MAQSSFYSDTPNYATDFPTQNDSNSQPVDGNPSAPSSFYPDGGVYAALRDSDTVVATMTALAAAAAASQSAAAISETHAAASDTDATAQASTATTQAGIATTQAGIATTKAANALTSETNAHTSEVNAAASASTATTQAGTATTQAGIATTQAGISTTQAGAATTQAGNAATSATNAATSETNALASKNAAATSASNAATSEANALGYKNAAATSATNAGNSETNALASKNAAATSATNAATSETNALASKNAAATSATNAATSETNAGNSATAAAGSAASALTYLKSFRDVYYGGLSADPSVDPDGNAPTSGDFYYHTSLFKFRSYNGTAWVDMVGSGGGNVTAQYALAAADGTLPNSRVLTNTTALTWDFSTAGQIKATLAQGYVRYDGANGLTAAQQAQARSNIGVEKKNYIINGAMMVSQENGTTAGTVSGYYPVDQFAVNFSNAGAVSIAKVAGLAPGGSPNRLRVTVTTADAAVGAGDYLAIFQKIEGNRLADLKIGSAAAKTITIQMGVKAPAGTYSIGLRNGVENRAYSGEYIISAGEANTDVVKTVTLALDQSGTWATDNTAGIEIWWALMAGSSFQITAGSWQTSGAIASSNQFNFMGTVGNVFELFDVGLYEGSVAPAFTVPDFQKELDECQRYFYMMPPTSYVWPCPGATYALSFRFEFRVSMRATPTITTTYSGLTNCTMGAGTRTTECFLESSSGLAAGNATFSISAKVDARL